MSILVEIRREECLLGRIIPCDGAYGQGPFWGLDWRDIKSWCPIEWAILGNTFLAKSIVPQEPSDIWDERCTSLHWDLGGRPYEGWIQCFFRWRYLGVYRILLVSILRRVAVDAF